jgi:hypothetical protein
MPRRRFKMTGVSWSGWTVSGFSIDIPGDVLIVALIASLLPIIFMAVLSWRLIMPITVAVDVVTVQFGLAPSFIIYSYNVAPLDILILGTLVAYCIRVSIIGRIGLTHLWWSGMAGLMLLALLRGIAANGLAAAIVSFRPDFYFIVAVLYMQSFRWEPRDIDHFALMWLIVAGALSGYALLGWIDPSLSVSMQAAGSAFFAFDDYLDWRVLPASSAIVIAQAGLMAVALWVRLRQAGLLQLAAIPLMLMVALLYHRSVWIAAAAGVAVLMVHRPRLLTRLSFPLLLVAFGLVLVWAFDSSLLTGAFQSAVSEPFRDNSTWGWRINNWLITVPDTLSSGPVITMLGWGYGTLFENAQTGLSLANPHNAYVAFFLNTGLAGLAVLVVCLLLSLRRLWLDDFPPGRILDRFTALMLLAQLMVYYVAYSVGLEQGILIGVLAGLAARCGVAEDRESAEQPLPAMLGASR